MFSERGERKALARIHGRILARTDARTHAFLACSNSSGCAGAQQSPRKGVRPFVRACARACGRASERTSGRASVWASQRAAGRASGWAARRAGGDGRAARRAGGRLGAGGQTDGAGDCTITQQSPGKSLEMLCFSRCSWSGSWVIANISIKYLYFYILFYYSCNHPGSRQRKPAKTCISRLFPGDCWVIVQSPTPSVCPPAWPPSRLAGRSPARRAARPSPFARPPASSLAHMPGRPHAGRSSCRPARPLARSTARPLKILRTQWSLYAYAQSLSACDAQSFLANHPRQY